MYSAIQHLKLEHKYVFFQIPILVLPAWTFCSFTSSLCQADEHDWNQDWFRSSPERTLRPRSVIRHPLLFGKQPCDCVLKQLGTFEVWLIISYSTEALGTKCDSRDAGTWPPSPRKRLSRHVGWQCVCWVGLWVSVRESERPEWASLVLPDLPGVKV